jgi:hypothetical protein
MFGFPTVEVTPERIMKDYRGSIEVRGGAVGWCTTLQAGRSRVRFSMVSSEFFVDIILPAALWPGVESACNRNEYQKYFLGGGVKAADA